MPSVIAGARLVVFHGDQVVFGGGATAAPATGGPGPLGTSYPWTLFRGRVIGVNHARLGELLRITLDCEDWNALWPEINVGAPSSGWIPPGDDSGTIILVDGYAQAAGERASGLDFRGEVLAYWPLYPPIDIDTHIVLLPDGAVLPDWGTAASNFKAFGDMIASYQGPYTRWWLDPDLFVWYTQLAPVGTVGDYAVPAPFAISEDGAVDDPVTHTIMPQVLTANWDSKRLRRRVFFKGGTPVAMMWLDGGGGLYAQGEDYIDAPGVVTADDAYRVGAQAIALRFRTMLTGNCSVESGHDGWRVGQTLYVTSKRLSRTGRTLDATPTIIQSVAGKLVSGGAGLTIDLTNSLGDISERVVISSFGFEESLGAPGKATVVLEVVDLEADDEFLLIPDHADIKISTDGRPAIEYAMTYGDIEPGRLTKELEPITFEFPEHKPVYHFNVTVKDRVLPLIAGTSTVHGPVLVKAQLSDESEKPVALAGVIVEWVVLDWADHAQTIPGDGGITLADATGVTDGLGAVYTTVSATDGTNAVAYKIECLALPI